MPLSRALTAASERIKDESMYSYFRQYILLSQEFSFIQGSLKNILRIFVSSGNKAALNENICGHAQSIKSSLP